MAKYTNKTFCRFGADSDTKFKFLGGDGRSVPCIMCTPTYVRGPLSSHSSVLPPIKYGARDPFIDLCIGCARAGNDDKDGAGIQNSLFWCFRMIYAMLVCLSQAADSSVRTCRPLLQTGGTWSGKFTLMATTLSNTGQDQRNVVLCWKVGRYQYREVRTYSDAANPVRLTNNLATKLITTYVDSYYPSDYVVQNHPYFTVNQSLSLGQVSEFQSIE